MWWTLPPFLASNIVVGTLFAPENSLFTQSWNKTNIPEFVLLPSNIVNIQILSLHFFSKTMKCPFNWILNLPLLTLPSMNLSFLHFLTTCLTFLSRGNTFHRPTWGAVKDSSLSKRLFVPHPTTSSHQERGLHPATYCPFHLIVKFFSPRNSATGAFLKKKRGGQSAPRSVTALYCFTRSGEVLHQTVGALQTAPPGPRGGHYDRDEQLEKHCKTDSGVTAGGGQDTLWGRNINWNVLSWNGSAFCFRGNFWQLGILLVSAVLQSNTSTICLPNLKPVNM